ncbi:hypothetical protein CYLTODRAFT_417390 [Cylindrobasidium torrendii FP15055 ss-10]|uniref:DUF6534 domain-containing protein n=1 Tax=Cylindrobasidium torrendii FP15055 ss-10 TaxID=1314674 RepID=A0A0D7BTE2_9AGAR|nr:hypothetical protein CYLTODRAFT_417390 [Cylindrobasidium torrendii FP15055 ss-10]
MGDPLIVKILAPFFVGAFMSSILYGICLLQMFTFYQTCGRDSLWLKLFILYLFLAETAKTVVDIGIAFEPILLDEISSVTITSPLLVRPDGLLTVLISVPAQLFMAWRIRVISQLCWPAGIIVLTAFVSFGGGIATTASVLEKPRYDQFREFSAAPITWLLASAATDVLVTVNLVYFLWRRQSAMSSDLVSRIISFNVRTGMITSAAAVSDAIVFIVVENSTIFFAWDLCLAKLYAISLLSSLNSRSTAFSEAQKIYDPNPLFISSQSGGGQVSTTLTFNVARPTTLNTTTMGMETFEMADSSLEEGSPTKGPRRNSSSSRQIP